MQWQSRRNEVPLKAFLTLIEALQQELVHGYVTDHLHGDYCMMGVFSAGLLVERRGQQQHGDCRLRWHCGFLGCGSLLCWHK